MFSAGSSTNANSSDVSNQARALSRVSQEWSRLSGNLTSIFINMPNNQEQANNSSSISVSH